MLLPSKVYKIRHAHIEQEAIHRHWCNESLKRGHTGQDAGWLLDVSDSLQDSTALIPET